MYGSCKKHSFMEVKENRYHWDKLLIFFSDGLFPGYTLFFKCYFMAVIILHFHTTFGHRNMVYLTINGNSEEIENRTIVTFRSLKSNNDFIGSILSLISEPLHFRFLV